MNEKLYEIIASVLNVNRDQINEKSNSDSIENWDSLNHMNLIMAIEEEFSVSFDEEEVIEMTSVQDILQFLETNT